MCSAMSVTHEILSEPRFLIDEHVTEEGNRHQQIRLQLRQVSFNQVLGMKASYVQRHLPNVNETRLCLFLVFLASYL